MSTWVVLSIAEVRCVIRVVIAKVANVDDVYGFMSHCDNMLHMGFVKKNYKPNLSSKNLSPIALNLSSKT